MALYRWLLEDTDVAATAELALDEEHPYVGSMGGAGEVINLILTHGESLANVALAYATWRRSRAQAPALTFKNDRTSITVEDGSPETVQRLIDAFAGGASQSGITGRSVPRNNHAP